MSDPLARWSPHSLEARLAALALALGILALFGSPQSGDTVTINSREMASLVESEVDHVTVQELADWIIQGRGDMRLLDLRPAEEYAGYHVPGAENVLLTDLLDYPLYRNERIVLYSGGGIHSAQAWFLLQAHGFRGSYILLGGLDAWKDEILFPILPNDDTPAAATERRRVSSISEHFGGTPRSAVATASLAGGSAVTVTAPEMPEMPAVAPPTAPPVQPQRKRKAKEGC